MLDKKLVKAINDQINFEMYSSYIYLGMSAYFSSENLPGFANWMKVQTREELVHAMKLYNYIFDRDSNVELQKIDAPPAKWKSALDAFETAYKHEQKVTSNFHNLIDICNDLKDHTTNSFLQWFINEQVEEEASAKAIVDQLKVIKNMPQALYMLDRELGQRVFTMPAGITI